MARKPGAAGARGMPCCSWAWALGYPGNCRFSPRQARCAGWNRRALPALCNWLGRRAWRLAWNRRALNQIRRSPPTGARLRLTRPWRWQPRAAVMCIRPACGLIPSFGGLCWAGWMPRRARACASRGGLWAKVGRCCCPATMANCCIRNCAMPLPSAGTGRLWKLCPIPGQGRLRAGPVPPGMPLQPTGGIFCGTASQSCCSR